MTDVLTPLYIGTDGKHFCGFLQIAVHGITHRSSQMHFSDFLRIQRWNITLMASTAMRKVASLHALLGLTSSWSQVILTAKTVV